MSAVVNREFQNNVVLHPRAICHYCENLLSDSPPVCQLQFDDLDNKIFDFEEIFDASCSLFKCKLALSDECFSFPFPWCRSCSVYVYPHFRRGALRSGDSIGNTPDASPQTKPSRSKKKQTTKKSATGKKFSCCRSDVLRRELRKVRNCKKSGRLIEYEDGERVFVPHRCGSILCPDCQEYFFGKAVTPYLPEMEKLQDLLKKEGRSVKHITLTLPAMPASEQVKRLKEGFSRFLDLRLGPSVWAELKREALERIAEIESARVRARQRWILLKMEEGLRRLWKRRRNLKVRDILKGLAVLDAKETLDNLHFHLHLVVFARNPISSVILALLWEKATGVEANVHIKEHPSLKQLLGYLSTVSLPKRTENKIALVKSFRNVKRVWSFGLRKVRDTQVSRRRVRKEIEVEFAFSYEGIEEKYYYRRDGEWMELYRVSDNGWELESRFWDPPPV